MTVFTLAIDDSIFKPDEHALHLRTANTAAVSVDYIWLDDVAVAQFQDGYDTQGVHIGTEVPYLHSDHLGTPRIGTARPAPDRTRQAEPERLGGVLQWPPAG